LAHGRVDRSIPFHPLANIFPLMQGSEFDDLVADIKTNRLNMPIVLHEGMILDGRNRYRACIAAGVEPRFESYDGKDPAAFVVSANAQRRHLNTTQRALAAAELACLREGQRADLVQGTSIDVAARRLSVGRASVDRAKVVVKQGVPELRDALRRGKIAISAAAEVAKLPADQQRELIERDEVDIEAKRLRSERSDSKRRRKRHRPSLGERKQAEERAEARAREQQARVRSAVTKLIADIGREHALIVHRAMTEGRPDGVYADDILDALKNALSVTDDVRPNHVDPEDDGFDIPENLRREVAANGGAS
jgi:ParB-like chromosome segregation protein Spo0J